MKQVIKEWNMDYLTNLILVIGHKTQPWFSSTADTPDHDIQPLTFGNVPNRQSAENIYPYQFNFNFQVTFVHQLLY